MWQGEVYGLFSVTRGKVITKWRFIKSKKKKRKYDDDDGS